MIKHPDHVCYLCHSAPCGLQTQGKRSIKRFCSNECMHIYQQLKDQGYLFKPYPIEENAYQNCLQALGQVLIQQHQMQTPIARFSKAQMIQLVHIILSTYQTTLKHYYQQELTQCSTSTPSTPHNNESLI